jgi:NADH dehydrogenase
MTISPDDVRQLLQADADAVLVLIEGRAQVIAGTQVNSDDFRGALEVIAKRDLLERVGSSDLSDHEAAEQAASLDAMVSELGG